MSRGACAVGSLRTIRSGGAVLRVCCPKGPGHWKAGKCRVGTRVYEVGHPALAGVVIPRAHLKQDVKEARAMVRELQKGIRRDEAALRKGR